ncbi:arsenite efflux pump ACR3 [Corynebacterium deserti GIMN1.010]|uniref:Arsenite efflux pump ACR3 n=1 Tax=Corynebacterium deserti GIMN1.010 TaxID=931089 RepID=A0A0M3Q9M0_9CORY|nr:arsenic resistance protein [Corynebacterium deserti]ALC05833.1 arsenite efflux pump ACR3 [Corynebacterium deserti GIMN1.010]
MLTRFQIPLYLLALFAGAAVGLIWPSTSTVFEASINPILMVLLYATFLGIPLTRLKDSWKDLRFVSSVLAVNFIAVPIVVFVLSRFFSGSEAILFGFLLVLLAPCVDYVIVFSGLAGAATDKLLAATPLLMLGQIIMIPIFLTAIMGGQDMDITPFIHAFFFLIVIPLIAAAITQALRISVIIRAGERFMVPLMMLTLFVVVASQIDLVRGQIGQVVQVVPLYVAFLVIMIGVGLGVAKLTRLGAPETRAVIFSGGTRNSLVVLPLALASGMELAVTAVVTQTLVELVGMVMYVRFIPYITPQRVPRDREVDQQNCGLE